MPRQLLFLPGPVMVAQPVMDALVRPLIDHRGSEFAGMLERIGAGLRPIFGTSRDVVILGSSGTGGLEAVFASLFSPGDRLLSCPVGSFGKRFATIAQSCGCVVETIETPAGAALDPNALEQRLREDASRGFAGVLLTHNETSTGVANDMRTIAPMLREHGALTLVDSVSGLGAGEFKMDEWGYDAVVTASQKALAAPPGVAAVALSERAAARAAQAHLPGFYFDLARALESAAKGQMPWTPPISILFALEVALQRYHDAGMPAVFERHRRSAAEVRESLQRAGFTLFSRPGAHSDTVVAVYPPNGVAAAPLIARLREEHGVVLSGGLADLAGTILRFGTMGEYTHDELTTALRAVENAVGELTSDVA